MESCTSIFFDSQIDEILEDIESIRLCREVEEADLFSHCFLEDYVDDQHVAVENHNNQPQLQAGGALKRKSESVINSEYLKHRKMDKTVSTSSNTTGESCTEATSTSGIATEGSHTAVASYPDNIHTEPHTGDRYLEWRLLKNGGSVEKAKIMIDKMCTLRTLSPQLFGVYNVKEDFAHVIDNGISYALPKIMDEDIRVYFVKFFEKDHIKTYFVDFLRYVVIMAEYMMYHDYLNKTIIVFDFLDANLNSFVTEMDFMEFKRHITILLEGFRMKPQKILAMTQSKLVIPLLAIMKTLLKPKIIQRIQVIRNHEELREIVPREILPKDYGGDDIDFKDIKENWVNELSSQKTIDMLKQRSKERTDESLRASCQFSEQYAGMEGTFRFLRVD